MRKTRFIILFLLLLVILSACNDDKTSSFFGENENWLVKFNISKKNNLFEGTYIVEYTGGNLEELLNKEIFYEVGFKEPTTGGVGFLNDEGVLEGRVSKKSCYSDCDSSELVFNVIIDGKVENIMLNKK
ncbi:hypothetical protein [Psychrobacillus sp. L3]|uniref:hypothetical protein n=1 Tax=Psychrobacillus sp. L3 TaxID=3236891 RepID=UPI0036F1BAB9